MPSALPDLSDVIGVRFIDHGRSIKSGFDCYGLAIEVSRRFGHELPDLWYRRSDASTFNNNAENVLKELSDSLAQTNEQEAGNLVIFLDGRRMVHIGVILEEDVFIHCDIYGVRIVRLSEYYRRNWKIYRWL